MFERLIRELKSLEGSRRISIPIQSDKEGYIDKECPFNECKYQFKVYEQDWKDLFKDEAVYCPMCGHKELADKFWTTEQVEQSKQKA